MATFSVRTALRNQSEGCHPSADRGPPVNPVLTPPPARLAEPPGALETVVDAPAGWPCRRREPRFPAHPEARAEVRLWGGGAGPDVALRLLEVSEAGLRVQLRLPARPDDRFQVTLWGPGGARVGGRVMAVARWTARSPDGTVVAGLEFGRPLLSEAVRRLAAPTEQPATPSQR